MMPLLEKLEYRWAQPFNWPLWGLLAILLFIALLFGGCSSRLAAAREAGTVEGRAIADEAAKFNLTLLCATTIGAYFRLDNAQQQEGIRLICSPGGVSLEGEE